MFQDPQSNQSNQSSGINFRKVQIPGVQPYPLIPSSIYIRVCLKIGKTPKPNGFADHYPYEKWRFFIGNINPTFSDKPILNSPMVWSHNVPQIWLHPLRSPCFLRPSKVPRRGKAPLKPLDSLAHDLWKLPQMIWPLHSKQLIYLWIECKKEIHDNCVVLLSLYI